MILNAVQRAFNRDNAPPPSAEPKKVAVRKGGLEVVYHVKVGESCCIATALSSVEAPDRRLAAATDEGDVVFLDAADGTVRARCDAADEPPNALAFAAGQLRVSDMIATGIYLNVIALLLGSLVLNTSGVALFGLQELPPWANATAT